jgi:hypothetical protein
MAKNMFHVYNKNLVLSVEQTLRYKGEFSAVVGKTITNPFLFMIACLLISNQHEKSVDWLVSIKALRFSQAFSLVEARYVVDFCCNLYGDYKGVSPYHKTRRLINVRNQLKKYVLMVDHIRFNGSVREISRDDN